MHTTSFNDFFAATKRAGSQQTLNSLATPVSYSHVAAAPGPPVFSDPTPSSSAPSTSSTLAPNIHIYTQPPYSVNAINPGSGSAPTTVPQNTWKRSNSGAPGPPAKALCSSSKPASPHLKLYHPPEWNPADHVPANKRFPKPSRGVRPHISGVTTDEAQLNELAAAQKCFICLSAGHTFTHCPDRERSFKEGKFFYYPVNYIPRI